MAVIFMLILLYNDFNFCLCIVYACYFVLLYNYDKLYFMRICVRTCQVYKCFNPR